MAAAFNNYKRSRDKPYRLKRKFEVIRSVFSDCGRLFGCTCGTKSPYRIRFNGTLLFLVQPWNNLTDLPKILEDKQIFIFIHVRDHGMNSS